MGIQRINSQMVAHEAGAGVQVREVRMTWSPPLVVRLCLLADLGLAAFPPWTLWLLRRWTGRWWSLRDAAKAYVEGWKFCARHIVHALSGTSGLGMVSWTSPPLRAAQVREREDHEPKGSCGSCYNCCQTYWEAPERRMTCPLKSKDGCQAYGSLWWDYFNCGSYPVSPRFTKAYECPRFEGAFIQPERLSISSRSR